MDSCIMYYSAPFATLNHYILTKCIIRMVKINVIQDKVTKLFLNNEV